VSAPGTDNDNAPNVLTVLTTVGPLACKTITRQPDSTVLVGNYDRAKQFTQRTILVDPRGDWLRELRTAEHSLVVLGEPVDWPLDVKKPRKQVNFRDVPRRVMPIDLDGFEPDCALADGDEFARQALAMLGMAEVACTWHLTGQHGINNKRRIRLWVPMLRPATCADMAAWAVGKPIDASVYQTQQPIYTADPRFVGMESPVEERVGTLDGKAYEIPPAPKGAKYEQRPKGAAVIEALMRAGLYLRDAGNGKHFIDCPWEEQHGDGEPSETDTAYFEPNTNGYAGAGFRCQHAHCRLRTISDLLAALGMHSEDGFTVEDFVFHMPRREYISVLNGERWKSESVDEEVRSAPDGREATAYLRSERKVHSITWAPGRPQIVEDYMAMTTGGIAKVRARALNLYRGPEPLTGGDPMKATMWVDHVKKLYPVEADWRHLFRMLGFKVQHPGVKINHAIFCASLAFGIGKDTVFDAMIPAVGAHNFQDIGPKAVMGRFNAFQQSIVLRISESRDSGEYDKYALEQHLKPIIAAPPNHFRIDPKGVPEYYVENVVLVVITSNDPVTGIYIPHGDRRYFALVSHLTLADFASDYFLRLWYWLEQENGFAHVAAFLREVDLGAFDPKAVPPRNAAWQAIVAAGMSGQSSAVEEALEELGDPKALTVNMLMSKLDDATREKFRKGAATLPGAMGRARYSIVPPENGKERRWKKDGQRFTIYAKVELSERERYAAANELVENGLTVPVMVKREIVETVEGQINPKDEFDVPPM
jgi:Family of unknown function (DUF5906)